jgi:lysozyme family protein
MPRRRKVLLGLAAASMAGSAFPIRLLAQGSQRPSETTAALEERARKLGISTPMGDPSRMMRRSAQELDSYSELLPRLVDLITRADQTGGPASEVAEAAAELLARIHRAERSFAFPLVRKAPAFESVRAEYRRLFDSCQIGERNSGKVDQHVETLKTYRPRYEAVGTALSIPWYFIGIVHALEAGFNFRTHLHNGDDLQARTVQVPKGRPVVWNPPTDWQASAQDALRMKKFDGQSDWSLEQTLYRWETYNGFGYRNKKGSDGKPVYSPYLWSFSNNYAKGKYVRDGVWDPNYVSQQCGACTMLKRLIETKVVEPL